MSQGLASVVVERMIDIFIFLLLFCGAILCSKQQFLPLWHALFPLTSLFYWSRALIIIATMVLAAACFKKLRLTHYKSIQSLRIAWGNFKGAIKQSLQTIFLAGKSSLFLVTPLIWLFHFLVEYITLFTLSETTNLGLGSALHIFLSINLAMLLPVPGGIGTYHFLVTLTLSNLGVSPQSALIYATLTHAIQAFNALIVGGLCLFKVMRTSPKKIQDKD